MSFASIFAPETHATSAGGIDNDPYNLERFIQAQDQGNAFNEVLAAFCGGHAKPKPTTWMWFVFPQMNHCQTQSLRARLSNDGISYEDSDEQTWRRRDVWPRAQALTSLDEARAYLRHPILGDRARQAAQAVLDSPFADKFALMDNISMDVARLHSSMTIFRQASRFPQCIHSKESQMGENAVFALVINRFFVSFAHRDEENDLLDSGDKSLMARRRGSRHKPTLECLDWQEQMEIERRMKEGLGCVCGRGQELVKEMDQNSKRKMENARAALEAEKKRKREKKLEKRRQQQEKDRMEKDDEGKSATEAGAGP